MESSCARYFHLQVAPSSICDGLRIFQVDASVCGMAASSKTLEVNTSQHKRIHVLKSRQPINTADKKRVHIETLNAKHDTCGMHDARQRKEM
jgi:hypothetical protein